MQTLEYVRALKKIVEHMRVPELIQLLEPLMLPTSTAQVPQGQKDQFASLLFSSRAGYERLMEDSQIAKILTSLEVGSVYDSARLGRLVSIFNAIQNVSQMWGTPAHTVEVFSFYDQLKALKAIEKSCSELLGNEKLGSATPGEFLELQLLDYDGTGIEASRLEQFISGISQLHTDFALIFNVRSDKLRFLYFDSGSDLIVAIQCAKPILDSIKAIFGEWWEKVRFRSFDTFDRKLDAVAKSLTVIGTVHDAVTKNIIDQGTGDVLKTRILREVDDLIGIGVSLPIHSGTETIDHRKLLVEMRDTKLLGSGGPSNSDVPPTQHN